ncbi:MAG: iron-sulfur cluster assembly scaffold protein [Parcubacteria group bacterium]
MQYSKELMEHFQSPHNQGKIEDADAIGEVGNIKCGDIMKIYLKVGKNKKGEDFIKNIKFETLGCAAAIAATSVLTDLAKGKTFKQALAITKDDIVKVLKNVPPIKYHCSILAEEALRKAIEEYEKTN